MINDTQITWCGVFSGKLQGNLNIFFKSELLKCAEFPAHEKSCYDLQLGLDYSW